MEPFGPYADGCRVRWRKGVSGVAESEQGWPDRDGLAVPSGNSLIGTVMLGLLIFGLGAAAGFLGRLLWPHSR